MEVPLDLQAAILQALFAGPGDRLDLIDRIAEHARGQKPLTSRRMSRALRELEEAGLLRHWGVRKGERRSGDPSVYYELTVEGVTAAGALRDVVAGFLAKSAPRGRRMEGPGMDARLRRSLEISALAQNLRRGNRKLRT